MPLWAVHVSDLLNLPMVLAGFAVTGFLVLIACLWIKEEDVPRVALLAAAFFVASSIHVKVGPTSVHLLLNGLVGVMLGWRAPLAILCGVSLQALLVGHGGISAIGVNAAVQSLPALLAAGLFALLRDVKSPWARRGLMATSALLWGACLLCGVALLATRPLGEIVSWGDKGLVLGEMPDEAAAILLHPVSLALLAAFTLAACWVEVSGEFAVGVLVGVVSVLGALILLGAVLLLDGQEKWGRFVSLVFVVHLPLALLEGVIVGLAVAFLARVKPALLRPTPSPAAVAVLCLLALGAPAWAHGLETKHDVDRVKKTVTVTVFFELGDAPRNGHVKVTGPGGVVAEGQTDKEGRFTFAYERAERLEVQTTAEGGHSARFTIHPDEIPAAPPTSTRAADLMAGVALLLALAAFVMAWLNAARLRRIEEKLTGTPP